VRDGSVYLVGYSFGGLGGLGELCIPLGDGVFLLFPLRSGMPLHCHCEKC
jgi:hypothetical protein